MLLCKIDKIWNKIKNGKSDILCKHQHTFLSINYISNFKVMTVPEETRDSWRKDILIVKI